MPRLLGPAFAVAPSFSGFRFFIEHSWKGGLFRLRYEAGEVVEMATLRNNGCWVDYQNISGIYSDDYWIDCSLEITNVTPENLYAHAAESLALEDTVRTIDPYGKAEIRSYR